MTNFNNRPVEYLVAWPLNESEAGVDLVLIEVSHVKGNLHSHNKYCLKCSKYP